MTCLANKRMFERLVWERHPLAIVTLQLTHNSYQDTTRLNHALFCRSEHFLDFAFVCLLALVGHCVPVPAQLIKSQAKVERRSCCRSSLLYFTCKDWLQVGKDYQ